MNPFQVHKLTHQVPKLFLLLSIITLSSTGAEMQESDLMVTFSPGAYFEEHDVDLYDSVVPILFKFQLPEWMEQGHLKLPECTNDTFDAGPLCPVFFHLNKKLLDDLSSINTLPFTLPEAEVTITFDCHRLSQHFLTERILTANFNEYVALLQKCANGKFWESSLIVDYSTDIQFIYETMIRKFMLEFYEKLPEKDRVKKASDLNDKTALTGLLHMHYLSLIKRWRRGTLDCKRGFIPDSLVSEKNLRQALEAMEVKIRTGSPIYRYTMPYEESQITRYYNAPIADCVYTTNKFYVRILVPVTKVRKSPVKLLNIRAIPFLSVMGTTPHLCMIGGFSKGRLFNSGVEVKGTTGVIGSLSSAIVCDTANFKLCWIPDPYDSFPDPATDCARTLIDYDNDPSNENDALLHKTCKLDCSIISKPESFPFVVRAHDQFDTVYLVMDPDKPTGVDLECFNVIRNGTVTQEDTYVVRIPSIKKGALGLVLPCNCRLPLPTHNILAGSDCPDTLMVFKVVPFQDVSGVGANQQAAVVDADDAA